MIRLENSNPKKCGDSTRGILYTCYNSITTIRRASQQMAGGWVVFLWLLRQWCNVQSYHQGQVKLVVYFLHPTPTPPKKKRIPLLVELKNIPPYIFQDPFEWVRRWFVSGGLKSHPFFRLGDDVSDSRFPRCRPACASWSPGGNIDAGMGGIWQVVNPPKGSGNSPWLFNSTHPRRYIDEFVCVPIFFWKKAVGFCWNKLYYIIVMYISSIYIHIWSSS